MAMTDSRCLSNTVIADKYLMWDIPDEWTLEQAATVPVVYGTVSIHYSQSLHTEFTDRRV